MEISLIDPFIPDYGDSFQILTYDSVAGRFEIISGASVNTDMILAPLYAETDLTLVAALPGDNTLDGSVDAADLALVRNGFGDEGGWTEGDSTLDNLIDAADLANVRNHFGSSVLSAPTPEPSTLVVLLVATMGFPSRTHRFAAA